MAEAPMGMPPIRDLKIGQVVSPRVEINQRVVDHMVYARECDSVGGGLTMSARLEVSEKSALTDKLWVRLKIVGVDPPRFLKVDGSELGAKFVFKG
jgi:hypothetical protein